MYPTEIEIQSLDYQTYQSKWQMAVTKILLQRNYQLIMCNESRPAANTPRRQQMGAVSRRIGVPCRAGPRGQKGGLSRELGRPSRGGGTGRKPGRGGRAGLRGQAGEGATINTVGKAHLGNVLLMKFSTVYTG